MTVSAFKEIIRVIHNGIASACTMFPRYGVPKNFYSQVQNFSKDWESVSNDIKKSMKHFKDLDDEAKKRK